ncbi:MAG TPA: ATP-binding protein [Desulfobacteraceae bacterium]|nr:ATP-binding protein [Desulfobacteraceae bacterium]
MSVDKSDREVPVEQMRWRLDPAGLPFETTDDLEPLSEIVGQDRGVEAFRFGAGIRRHGYNVFVTGISGTGRMATARRMLEELIQGIETVPDDLCYVNNFKKPEYPILLKLPGGVGARFKKTVDDCLERLKKEIPQIFESQEYINLKKEIMEAYEAKGKSFFKNLDQKVKEEGFALVDVQVGQIKRPEVVPLIDGNPTHLDQVEEMVEKGRFPKEEFEELKEKHAKLREQIDQIFLELRDLQKGVQEKLEKMDRVTFLKNAEEIGSPVRGNFPQEKIQEYFQAVIEDMAGNLQIFRPQQQTMPGMPALMPEGDPFQPYKVNLMVDNSECKGPPVIVEAYPTYRNIFGSIERIVDRSGVWRTDFSKIKAGSLLRANGGYLVFNLLDAAVEPGVWQGLKRALKSSRLEIQTYDPFYLFTTSGLKPEPIDLDVKVVVIGDPRLYHLLLLYDEDVRKIFKVRADFDTTMNRTDESIHQIARFIKMKAGEEDFKPLDRSAVATLIEEAVRMTGRQEKISTSFPILADIVREAEFFANADDSEAISGVHVEKALEAKIYRSNLVEEQIQEMIDRGTLLLDVTGSVVGQVNGLAVYSFGDYMFGKPSRITATTSMGRAGIINIEREADLSGSTHNKGVLILSGYLRKKFAQDKPLTMSASIAFEQSYGGVDGDSASSTEIYALLSSLSGVPINQSIAVTGSVNQNGEVQAIGGVNQKIEGFYACCKRLGLTGGQGVIIPESNRKDLMLRKEVVDAVQKGEFHIYSVSTVDQGIEILTGVPAGERGKKGAYPKGTVNFLVDKKLRELAEGLAKFGNGRGDEGEKATNTRKGRGKKSA